MYTNAVYFHNGHIARGETPAKLDYACINLVYYAYASIAPDGIVNVRTKDIGQYAALPFFFRVGNTRLTLLMRAGEARERVGRYQGTCRWR